MVEIDVMLHLSGSPTRQQHQIRSLLLHTTIQWAQK